MEVSERVTDVLVGKLERGRKEKIRLKRVAISVGDVVERPVEECGR